MLLSLILASAAGLALSGLPSLAATAARPARGQSLGAACAAASAAVGLAASAWALARGAAAELRLVGAPPFGGLVLRLDPLSSFFLAPVFLMGVLGSAYASGYWRPAEHPRALRSLRAAYGLCVASMVLVLLAGDGVSLLFSWELMALSAFFMVVTEQEKASVRRAGWLYLLAAHAGTLFLTGAVGVLRAASASFELAAGAFQGAAGLAAPFFVLCFLGFGMKAAVMPLHFWLPDAHAQAPSHVSALLSGLVIKMGIYGLLRASLLAPLPGPGWGALILLLGGVSGVLGVLQALGQHDLKRLLAYHSVENIGIILMGLGLALLGRSLNAPALAALGLAGCLLHVWNHFLFKSLLFFGAGSVQQATGIRDLDRLGGLGKSMPLTALFFLTGAAAICGLPPLNGFASEFLVVQASLRPLIQGGPGWVVAVALVVPVLGLIGCLAVACFVKACGSVFLGERRDVSVEAGGEAPASMLAGMAVLAAGCAALGLFPSLLVRPLSRVFEAWAPGVPARLDGGAVADSLGSAGLAAGALWAVIGAAWLACAWLDRRGARPAATWACAYPLRPARMQTSASSLAQMLVRFFRPALRPSEERPGVAGSFPAASRYAGRVADPSLESLFYPPLRWLARRVSSIRWIQRGGASSQRYLLVVLTVLLVLLLRLVPWQDLLTGVF